MRQRKCIIFVDITRAALSARRCTALTFDQEYRSMMTKVFNSFTSYEKKSHVMKRERDERDGARRPVMSLTSITIKIFVSDGQFLFGIVYDTVMYTFLFHTTVSRR